MLAKAGLEVAIEAGAGAEAGYPDTQYQEKGAKVLPDRAAVFSQCDIIAQVLCHGANDKNGASDLPLMRRGQVLVGFLRPLASAEMVQQVAQTGVTSFAVELMPRTTRAQSMDALSAMASIAGYNAVLVAADMVKSMAPGSVVLDLAAERGGNCELTRPGEIVVEHGVTLIGTINLTAGVPHHASQMYARNLTSFLTNLVKDGKIRPAESDEIIRDTLLTQDGEVVNARVRELL